MASVITGCTAEEAIRAKAQLEELAPDDRAGEVDAVLGAIAGANTAAQQPDSATEAEPEAEPESGVEPKPASNPKRAWTELVTDLPTLLGLSTDPGYLLGYGPLGCDQSRVLAGRSRWKALVTIGEKAIAALLVLVEPHEYRCDTGRDHRGTDDFD
jgi:hypothetical protein